MNTRRLIIYTVGKTIDPIEYSLRLFASHVIEGDGLKAPPDSRTIEPSVLFVASSDTLDNFEKAKIVARSLGAAVLNNFQPVMVDPFDLRNIKVRVNDALRESAGRPEDYDEVIFDLTGGTKAMSAALSTAAFDVVKPGTSREVYLCYVPAREVPESQTTASAEPVLTRITLDDFLVPEIFRLFDNAQINEAFALAEYLSPHNHFHRWLRNVTRLAYALDRFATDDIKQTATEIKNMSNEAYREVKSSIETLDDALREGYLDILSTFRDRVDWMLKLHEPIHRLAKLEASGSSPTPYVDEHIDWMATNVESARLVPAYFLTQAVIRNLRQDTPLVIVLCYRALEASLQIEFLAQKRWNLWDFNLMKGAYPDIVKGNGVTMKELEFLVIPNEGERNRFDEHALKLREMRNHGMLAHGYQDYETRNTQDLINKSAKIIADLCYRKRIQNLTTAMERVSPLRRDCELWRDAMSRLLQF